MSGKIDIRQLTYVALMSGINISFILLNWWIPLFSLVLAVAVPFSACLVRLKCNFRYSFLYFFCSLAIPILLDFQTALFLLLPSVISGFLFGFLVLKKVHGFYLVTAVSLFQIGIQMLSVYLIRALYHVDMIEVYSGILGLEAQKFYDIFLLFFFLFGLIQMLFCYFIIESEIEKFGYRIDETPRIFLSVTLETIFFSVGGWLFRIFFPSAGSLMTGISLLTAVYLLFQIHEMNRRFTRILTIVSFVLGCITAVAISPYFRQNGFHFLFNLFSLTTGLNGGIVILYLYLFRKEKITPELFVDKTDEPTEY